MQDPRDPSMEDILASIKRVIAEEKELRTAALPQPPVPEESDETRDEEVLELDQPVEEAPLPQPPVETGPPLVSSDTAEASRQKLSELQQVAAAAPPPPQVNPLEEMVREMLRPVLKEWLDHHLPEIVDEHVKREISRITGAKF